MKIVSSLALLVAVGTIFGCATSPQVTSVPLNATLYNPGEAAQATLAPMGNRTELWVHASGVPSGNAVPARLYTYVYSGSCSSLGAKPVYKLNETVNAEFYSPELQGVNLQKSLPVSYETLHSSGYVLVVREAPADGGQDIFCGKLG